MLSYGDEYDRVTAQRRDAEPLGLKSFTTLIAAAAAKPSKVRGHPVLHVRPLPVLVGDRYYRDL